MPAVATEMEKFIEALIKDQLEDILGQERVKQELKSALLSKRHVIIVGPPGIGKTTLAKNVAKLLPLLHKDATFVRVQGSPDLTAEDLIGDIDPVKALEFGPLSKEAFTPGKIFKANQGILFFDEINRCSEKLQNALLQVLEERKATIGSYDVDFDADLLFIGTMNPEDSSTEKLSDVFLDRFDLITMGYPETHAIEQEIVASKADRLPVEFPAKLEEGVISFVRQLREDANIEKKPSVRATLGIIARAQAMALLRGGKRVTADDIKKVVVSVLSHRIQFKPSVKYLKDPEEYIEEKFAEFSLDHSLGGEG